MNQHTGIRQQMEALQDLLLAYATGKPADAELYERLRNEAFADPVAKKVVPEVVKRCRNLQQFWGFIQSNFAHYKERRQYLWEQFNPALDALADTGSPADEPVSEVLASYDPEHVQQIWKKALERRSDDPEGAITTARTLLETVCKHILDENRVAYDEGADLPKLYKQTAETLNLAPSQHTEQVFKQILGGCQSVVEGLGALRNKLSDAHGKGKTLVKPGPRHADLAVNLAGAMATFLIETWEAQHHP